MNWNSWHNSIARERAKLPKRMPKKLRIKIAKALSIIAALPLFTSWLFLISVPMMIPVKPTLWAKDKIRYFKEWVSLR